MAAGMSPAVGEREPWGVASRTVEYAGGVRSDQAMNALIVALVVIGASLVIAEAHLASYGLLGLAGVAALSAAAVLAADAAGGSAVLALVVVLPAALLMSGAMVVAARKSLAIRRQRPRAGAEALIGQLGVVRSGDVVIHGERWRARRSWPDEPAFEEGDEVVVERVQGLTLSVRRAEEWEVL
jgi:membrane-bound ClpP family serine protease